MSHWYSAVLLLRSQVAPGWDDDPVLDCQVRIIAAPDAEAAYQRAISLGAEQEHSYRNQDDDKVSWEFIGLHDLSELPEAPVDGAEVFSWRAALAGDIQVVPKDELTVFWIQANAHRRASDLLG